MFRSLRCLVLGAAICVLAPQVAQAEGDDGPPPNAGPWTMRAGGVRDGSIFEGELGFSVLPRLAYHYTLFDGFSIGGEFAFDYMGNYLGPGAAFTPTIALQMPMRLSFYSQGRLSAGMRMDPGLGVTFVAGNANLNILLETSANIGYFVLPEKFMIGGGLHMPIAIVIAPAVGQTGLLWPVLFGPILEFHPIPALAITGDLKFGPWITSAGLVQFGARMHVGVAYHF